MPSEHGFEAMEVQERKSLQATELSSVEVQIEDERDTKPNTNETDIPKISFDEVKTKNSSTSVDLRSPLVSDSSASVLAKTSAADSPVKKKRKKSGALLDEDDEEAKITLPQPSAVTLEEVSETVEEDLPGLMAVIRDEPRDLKKVAEFLFTTDLDPTAVGQFLSYLESNLLSRAEHDELRRQFCLLLDFSGAKFEEALRKYLTASGLRLPKESQQISRLLESFGNAYYEMNQDPKSELQSGEACFITAFALVVLNTDLNNPQLGNKKRRTTRTSFQPMTRTQFHTNLIKASAATENVSRKFADRLYTSIVISPIEWVDPLTDDPLSSPREEAATKGGCCGLGNGFCF